MHIVCMEERIVKMFSYTGVQHKLKAMPIQTETWTVSTVSVLLFHPHERASINFTAKSV